MQRSKRRLMGKIIATPKWLRSALAVLALLVLAGVLLFTFGHRQIEEWEYPRKYEEYVTYYSDKYGIDPLILYTFIRTESNFDPGASSSVDARGLMQITEQTFEWIKSNIAPTEDLTFEDMYDPETNIRFGCYFVSYCLLRYDDDIATAAAAYHNGWGTVDELLENSKYSANGVTLTSYPYPKMRQYVYKITRAYDAYCRLYGNEAQAAE